MITKRGTIWGVQGQTRSAELQVQNSMSGEAELVLQAGSARDIHIGLPRAPLSDAVVARRADLYMTTADRFRALEDCMIQAWPGGIKPTRFWVDDLIGGSYPPEFPGIMQQVLNSIDSFLVLGPDWLGRYVVVLSLLACAPRRVLLGKDPAELFQERIRMFSQRRSNFSRLANLALTNPDYEVNRNDDLLPCPSPPTSGADSVWSIWHSDWVRGTSIPLPAARTNGWSPAE